MKEEYCHSSHVLASGVGFCQELPTKETNNESKVPAR